MRGPCADDPVTPAVPGCRDCRYGFDLARGSLGPAIAEYVPGYQELLASEPAARLQSRAQVSTWTPLEYAGHVRDVLALFDRRIHQIIAHPGCDLEVIDHEAAVISGNYNDLEPAAVSASLTSVAAALRSTLGQLRPGQWALLGFRSGEPRSVEDIGHRAVHETRHHLRDIQRLLGKAQPPPATP